MRTPQAKSRLRAVAWDQAKITEAPVTFITVGKLADEKTLPDRLKPAVDAGILPAAMADGWMAGAGGLYAGQLWRQRDEAVRSARLRAGGQWAVRFRPIELKFNVVRRGECWLWIERSPARHLQAGDCFVISRTPFIMGSDPECEALNASDAFSQSTSLATLGAGDDVELLGGSVSLIHAGAGQLLSLLPPAIINHAASGAAPSFAWLLDELDWEWKSAQPGANAICNDLLRLIFVHALRHHISTTDVADLAWLGGCASLLSPKS